MVKDIDILINYITLTLKSVLSIKRLIIYLICLSLPNISSIINIGNKLEDVNSWDSCFYLFENKFFYLFIFLGLFLLSVIKICNEYKSNSIIISKLRYKSIWLNTKLLTIVIFSFFYTTFHFLLVFLISICFFPFEAGFSIEATNPNSLLYHAHHYAMNLSVGDALFILYVKHLLGVIFIGILFLTSYTFIKNHKIIYSSFVIILYFIISYTWNLYVITPCFSVSPRSIFLYKKGTELIKFLSQDNLPLIITMCIMYIIILLRISKLEFME